MTGCASLPTGNASPGCSRRWATCTTRCGRRTPGRFIRPSLELVEEIQRTGDIFFPSGWLDATLGGHNSAEVADTVRGFLDGLGQDYPRRLREKILQSADMLFRSASISGP